MVELESSQVDPRPDQTEERIILTLIFWLISLLPISIVEGKMRTKTTSTNYKNRLTLLVRFIISAQAIRFTPVMRYTCRMYSAHSYNVYTDCTQDQRRQDTSHHIHSTRLSDVTRPSSPWLLFSHVLWHMVARWCRGSFLRVHPTK